MAHCAGLNNRVGIRTLSPRMLPGTTRRRLTPPPPKDQPAQPWLDTSSDESYARTLKALKAWQRGELAEPVIDPQDGAIAAADLLPPQGDLPTGDELPAEKEAPAEATAPASKTGNTGEGVEAPELPTVEEGEESDGA